MCYLCPGLGLKGQTGFAFAFAFAFPLCLGRKGEIGVVLAFAFALALALALKQMVSPLNCLITAQRKQVKLEKRVIK